MPEGPEVENVRRTLVPHLEGAVLRAPWVSNLKLRTPITRKNLSFLDGKQVKSIGRKGKVLWILMAENSLENAQYESLEGADEDFFGIFIRLGMSGRILLIDKEAPREKHTHVVLDVFKKIDDDKLKVTQLRYVDPRRFGEVVPFHNKEEWKKALAKLGPCPNAFSDEDRLFLQKKLQHTKRAIKDALLDQSVVCGVGNIYASEACFLAELSPFLAGSALRFAQVQRLIDATEQCMNEAVAHGGTSFSDYVDANGEQGQHQHYLQVFMREGEPCKRCVQDDRKKKAVPVIARAVQGGRSTFYCPICQAE